MKRKRFDAGQQVKVTYWNAEKQAHDSLTATIDYYSIDGRCWYFKKPCPFVWAYGVDMEPV